MWWLCARLLTEPDPLRAAWQLADEMEADPTPAVIARELADGAVVCTVGWPDLTAEALTRRGDLVVLASASAARAYAKLGLSVPAVSIGPETTAVAEKARVEVLAEARTHDLDGLVDAVLAATAA